MLKLCFSITHTHEGHEYVFVDGVFTWNQARAACLKKRGTLAMAGDSATFDVLRSLFDQYRAESGSAVGVWLDGKQVESGIWQCDTNNDECGPNMPWVNGAPPQLNSGYCVLIWHSRADGVANYPCTKGMPAICEVK